MPSVSTRPPAGAVIDFLASVKLAVVLLVVIALACLAGTLLPQDQPARYYQAGYSPGLARFILALGLDHVYSALWFVVLLFGLALNLIVCSLKRLPAALKAMSSPSNPESLRLPKVRLRRELIVAQPPDRALAAARQALGRLGRPLEGPPSSGQPGVILFSQAGRLSRLGAYVIHLAILVFFAAGLTTARWGVHGYVTLFEGQTADRISLNQTESRPLGFVLRLDKFVFEQYPDGTPKTFRSELSFLKDGRMVHQAKAEVNNPVDFGGLRFYMSNYGSSLGEWVELSLTRPGQEEDLIRLPVEGEHQVAGLGRLKLIDFRSDIRGIGPGARLSLTREGSDRPEVFWVISRPPFQMRTRAPEVFRLVGFDSRSYAGLQANHDPGVPLVWAGGIIMLLGLLAAFFWSHRRFWIQVSPQGQGSRLIVAGASNRNRPAFELNFGQFCGRLAASLAGRETPRAEGGQS